MKTFRAALACSLVPLLAACGGGGGESSGATSAPEAASQETFPALRVGAGDWYVYEFTTQDSTTTAPPSKFTLTRYIDWVTADGKVQYTQLDSEYMQLSRLYDVTGQFLASKHGATTCEYSAGYRPSPPPGAASGAAYNTSGVRTCRNAGSDAVTSTYSVTVTGKAEGPEVRTLPVGVFQTFRSSQNFTALHPDGTTVSQAKCWTDKNTGVDVECEFLGSYTQKGAVTAEDAWTSSMRLVAFGLSGQAPVGTAVRRFTGLWRVEFSGDDRGVCTQVRVAVDGAVSGTCDFGGMAPVAVTGLIDDKGVVRVDASNGARLTGTASTPMAASGTWALGNARGTWTARHY